MHYLITEDEYNRLESAMRQLGFISDLCAQTGCKDFQKLDVRGLLAFIAAQEDAIRQTITASEERHNEACELARTNGTMNTMDWMLALRIASGDHLHTPRGAVEQITRKLTLSTLADPDMQVVQSEWVKLLVGQSERSRPADGAASAVILPAATPVVRASKAKSNAAARTAKPKAAPRKRQQQAERAAA